MINKFQAVVAIMLVLLLSACNFDATFSDNHDFQEGLWNMDSIPSFEFEIGNEPLQDVAIKVRSNLEYPYYNLYLQYTITDQQGTELASDLVNFVLYDEETGKPQGKGNSIYQYAAPVLEDYNFTPGTYTFSVAQYMRMAELPGVLSVGVTVSNSEN